MRSVKECITVDKIKSVYSYTLHKLNIYPVNVSTADYRKESVNPH